MLLGKKRQKYLFWYQSWQKLWKYWYCLLEKNDDTETFTLTSLALLAGGTDNFGSGVQGLDWSFTEGPDLVCALKKFAECGLGASGCLWKHKCCQPFHPWFYDMVSSSLEFDHIHCCKEGFQSKIKNRTANKTDSDETAHYEPSHLDLHCLQRYISAPARIWGQRGAG